MTKKCQNQKKTRLACTFYLAGLRLICKYRLVAEVRHACDGPLFCAKTPKIQLLFVREYKFDGCKNYTKNSEVKNHLLMMKRLLRRALSSNFLTVSMT